MRVVGLPYGRLTMTTIALTLRPPRVLTRKQRYYAGLLVRYAREHGLPAGEGPSPFAYGQWAEQHPRFPTSGELRAAFGHHWQRALGAAGFDRYHQP